MTTTKSYDYLNRLTWISSVDGQQAPVAIFDYRYDSASQRTSVTTADGSFWSYAYDSLGQVISGRKYWADGKADLGQQFDYTFDDIGNRKTAVTGGDQWGANKRYQNYTATPSRKNSHDGSRSSPAWRRALAPASSHRSAVGNKLGTAERACRARETK